jgi:predicted ester cyclase
MSNQTQDQNKKNVERLFETFGTGDLATLEQLVAPEYVGPQGDKGPAGFRGVIVGLRTAFPDIRYTVDEMVAEGDSVAVRWHWTGTHRGPFRGYAPTGKAVSNSGSGIFRFQDDKVVSAGLETDRLGFLQQIGAVAENVGLGPRAGSPTPPSAAAAAPGAATQ